MEETIQVLVRVDDKNNYWVTIPSNINEVELKCEFRDLGYISSYRESYRTTKVYLKFNGTKTEICTDEHRSLKDLNIVQGSLILIESGIPEPQPAYSPTYYYQIPKPRYYSGGGGEIRALYGCPMAKSVADAICEAETYFESDSFVRSGSIHSAI